MLSSPSPPDARPERALFVFLDGVGLGPPEGNPLANDALPAFARLAGGAAWTDRLPRLVSPGHLALPLDATLGVAGLPQSGTGQAALFAGFNAARLHGAHYGPFPPTTVRARLSAKSVFARLVGAGVPPARLAFANAYPARFFRYAEARGRWTTTTLAAREAGVRLRTAADLARGRALPADLTGEGWRAELDPALRPVSEAEAAARLAALAASHAFTLFEYFLTDKAGHRQDPAFAGRVLASLDRFFAALVPLLDPARDLLVVSSDHGNVESLGTRSHTRNPVPLVALGPGAGAFAGATSLPDVTPLLVGLLGPAPPPAGGPR